MDAKFWSDLVKLWRVNLSVLITGRFIDLAGDNEKFGEIFASMCISFLLFRFPFYAR